MRVIARVPNGDGTVTDTEIELRDDDPIAVALRAQQVADISVDGEALPGQEEEGSVTPESALDEKETADADDAGEHDGTDEGDDAEDDTELRDVRKAGDAAVARAGREG